VTVPLSRNRTYHLLWSSQALSEVGFSATTIAFPLLVLALTNSPAKAGLVMGADAAAQLIAGLPAGALVDRWSRKRIMLCCEAVQAVAAASLVAAVWLHAATIAHITLVAVVLGVCRALFQPAEDASLPHVVPTEQLSTAVAMNAARGYLGQLSGTALGGFVFAIRRWLPFAVDTVAHTAAFVVLWSVRLPVHERERAPIGHLPSEIREGLRWIGGQRLLRTTALCAVGLNFFFQAFYLIVIALSEQRGTPSAQIGLMAAMLGAGGVLGTLAAPRLQRVLRPYPSIVGVFWALTALMPLALFIHNGYLMGLLFAAMAFLAPTASMTIFTYQLLLTPDELRGRATGAITVALGAAAVAGPAAGGAVAQVLPSGGAVVLCVIGTAVLTVFATVNPSLRDFPRLESQKTNAEVATEGISDNG
jgi:MFS family permease